MPTNDTRKYLTFLSKRLNETLVTNEKYESLVTTFQSYLADTSTAAEVNTLIDDLGDISSRLYLGIGRPVAWDNDNAPPTPETTTQAVDYICWRDLMAMKRIESANTAYVISRVNWETNTIYTQYDDTVENIANTNVYALDTNELPYKVYKCLWNNNDGRSTTAPSTTGNTVSPVATADGYVWQYLYSITTDDYQFLTTSWMPVRTDSLVRTYATDNPGKLSTVVPCIMTANGTNYDPAGTLTVTVTGDGNGAIIAANTLSLTFTSNTTTNITPSNGGIGYTTVDTIIVEQSGRAVGSTNATARMIIPVYPNHGYDPQRELGASAIMLNTTLQDDETDQLSTVNDYRRIMLIDNPLLANGASANGSFYRQTFDITLSANTGVFAPDDGIKVTNNTAYAVTATVVDTVLVSSVPVVRVTDINDKGRDVAFQIGDEVTDTTTEGVIGVVSAISAPQLKPFSGDVLYVDQRAPVTRDPNQAEDIKLIFRFN
jgi:hypothetical protein